MNNDFTVHVVVMVLQSSSHYFALIVMLEIDVSENTSTPKTQMYTNEMVHVPNFVFSICNLCLP